MRIVGISALAALLAGCATAPPQGLPAVSVTAQAETVPVGTAAQDAADDPAIWRNAANPAASLIVATDKKAGLYVYGLDGAIRSFSSAGLVNNVDLAEVPGFGVLARSRTGTGPAHTVGVEACPGARPAMTQALPESVVYELQALGVDVRRAGVTGVYGSRRGFWFGFTHDVVVRIRPGRTDIRVAARDGRPHGN